MSGDDRLPEEEYSLSNCTWYRESACCKRTEVASVFREMPALLTKNKGCYNRMNYLMCYFCSPQQNLWYNQTLSICHSYCEDLYNHCSSAEYNGQSILSHYESGIAFCKALAFNVVGLERENHEHCYAFDEKLFQSNGSNHVFCMSNFVKGLVMLLMFFVQKHI